MAWFSEAARARRRARRWQLEFAALGRVGLAAEEAEVLVPHCRALLQQLATALPAGPARDAVLRLHAVQVGDVDGLRVWLAQLRLTCTPLRYPAPDAPPLPAAVAALVQALQRAADGWSRASGREAATRAAFAGARAQASPRSALWLAVALSVVPFAISDCMDSYRAARTAAAQADDDACEDDADAAVPRPI